MGSSKYEKILRIGTIVLIALGVILFLRLAFQSSDDLENVPDVQSSYVVPMLNFGYWLTIITALIAIVASGFNLVVNPKGIRNAIIGVVGLGVIIGVSYAMSSGEDYAQYKDIDEPTLKMVGMALNTFYIVGLLALLSVVYSAVARIFK